MSPTLRRQAKAFASAALLHSCLFLIGVSHSALAQEEPPTDWVEPATGHRVVRLSREPGSQSLYFHQNPYSANGKKLIFTNRHGIAVANLETREIKQVV